MGELVKILIAEYAMLAERREIDDLLIRKVDIDRAVAGSSLTIWERIVIRLVSLGYTREKVTRRLGITCNTFDKIFDMATDKIEKFLGTEYSDELLQKLIERYLGDEYVE